MTWIHGPVKKDRHPRPIVHIHASEMTDPRGMRATIGSRALGWRGDLRADGAVMQKGRKYIPLLTEHDWHRAEVEQLETFAPLIPIDKVWIATVGSYADSDPSGPEIAVPIPVSQANRITGRRVIHFPPDFEDDEERDLRAISEITPDGFDSSVLVARESDWYRWAWSGKIAPARRLHPYSVWLE